MSDERDPTNPFAPMDNKGWIDAAPPAAQVEFTDAYGKHAGTPEAVYQEGYLDGLAAAKEEAADALAAAQARIAALEDALTLAANRLDRLALELPFESRALSDCVEWCEEARAALAKGGEND